MNDRLPMPSPEVLRMISGMVERNMEAQDPDLVEELRDQNKLEKILNLRAINLFQSEKAMLESGMPKEQAREIAMNEWGTSLPSPEEISESNSATE